MQYKITLGDWSNDGHGRTETFIVEISSPYWITPAQMKENYDRNVARVGFGLDEICRDYEEYTPDESQQEALKSAGFEIPLDEDYEYGMYDDWQHEDYVRLAMWYIGDGIGGFEWEIVKENRMPTLIGGYGAIIESGAAYGMFS